MPVVQLPDVAQWPIIQSRRRSLSTDRVRNTHNTGTIVQVREARGLSALIQSRRSFLQGAGLGLLTFSLAGTEVLLTPRQARARGADFRVLGQDEVAILDAFGDILVPGAAEAGIAHFVDQQLSTQPNDCLLMARYMNVEPPYVDFYRAGLKAVDELSRRLLDKPFPELDEATAVGIVRGFWNSNPEGWKGPPAPLVYLLIRSDAVDVVYGTVEGFAKMKIPYMPHILPPRNW